MKAEDIKGWLRGVLREEKEEEGEEDTGDNCNWRLFVHLLQTI